MAAKAARRAAGKRVQAIAQGFADDLLSDEDAAFAVIDERLRVKIDTAHSAVLAGVKAVHGDMTRMGSQADMFAVIKGQHAAGITSGVPEVRRLGQTSRDKALQAIGAELKVCEQSLGSRYGGLADDAVKVAVRSANAVIEFQVAVYVQAGAAVNEIFDDAVRQGIRASAGTDEIVARLFSPEPVRFKDHGGRGLWWQSTSALHAAARAVSIAVANQVRQDAMIAFNDLGESR